VESRATRLLAWLVEVAEVLDFLNFRHNVRHWTSNPKIFFLISGHLKVGDFGLARDWDRSIVNRQSQAATPAYAAPGTIRRLHQPHLRSNTALAVVYCEMVSGRLPFTGVHAVDLVVNQATSPPNLRGVPVPDVPSALSGAPSESRAPLLKLHGVRQRDSRQRVRRRRRRGQLLWAPRPVIRARAHS